MGICNWTVREIRSRFREAGKATQVISVSDNLTKDQPKDGANDTS